MIKKYLKIVFFFSVIFSNPLFAQDKQKPLVLVSIAPYKEIAEQILGDTADVDVIVPPGASPHIFDPTPKQTYNLSRAVLWFRMGEGFESKLINVLSRQNPQLQIVDLRKGLNLITTNDHDHAMCHHADCTDPHTWLSPLLMQKQVLTISHTIQRIFPHYQKLYQKNQETLGHKLEQLNNEIKDILAPLNNRTIMVSHPAYAYFCRDFNLKQLSIEFEGKDPTPQQISKTLQEAKQNQIHTIFTQVQHRSKGAQLIANQINAKIVPLDPLSPRYFENMRHIAHSFAAK